MNKKGLSVITLIILFLLPLASQAFTTEKSLVPGEFCAAYREADAGWRIEGAFVTTNDIEFFICDMSNYTAWRSQGTFVRYNYSDSTLGGLISFTVPYESVWYVVFSDIEVRGIDNMEVEVNYIDQSNVTQTQVSWISQSPEIDILLIGFVGVVAIIGFLGILIVLRKVSRRH